MIRLSDDMLNWRRTYRITQEVAAQLAFVSVRAWRNWETERFKPSEDHYNQVRWVISQPPPWWGPQE
jgi:DNA-binding transcriptional regulator YiaG